jgi:hypothetical protein
LVPLLQTKEDAMPEVYVYAVEGRTIDQKRSLVKDITDAVVRIRGDVAICASRSYPAKYESIATISDNVR